MSAEQTRERILAAAVEEFGAKGYSGARTAGIAARAGVNQQLISYHFGGKQGLLDELRRRWSDEQGARSPAGTTFADSVGSYLDLVLDRPAWSRLVLWQALGDDPSDDEAAEARRERTAHGVDSVRSRQDQGEITADVDAEFVLLLSYLLAFAPIALPDHVRGILGVDPLGPEYREKVLAQLTKLLDPERESGAAD